MSCAILSFTKKALKSRIRVISYIKVYLCMRTECNACSKFLLSSSLTGSGVGEAPRRGDISFADVATAACTSVSHRYITLTAFNGSLKSAKFKRLMVRATFLNRSLIGRRNVREFLRDTCRIDRDDSKLCTIRSRQVSQLRFI